MKSASFEHIISSKMKRLLIIQRSGKNSVSDGLPGKVYRKGCKRAEKAG